MSCWGEDFHPLKRKCTFRKLPRTDVYQSIQDCTLQRIHPSKAGHLQSSHEKTNLAPDKVVALGITLALGRSLGHWVTLCILPLHPNLLHSSTPVLPLHAGPPTVALPFSTATSFPLPASGVHLPSFFYVYLRKRTKSGQQRFCLLSICQSSPDIRFCVLTTPLP